MAICAIAVCRDPFGYWSHPDFPATDDWSANTINDYLIRHQLEMNIIRLEDDNPYIAKRVFEHCDPDISDWKPTEPDGEGWFLASILDSEQGPACIWLRPIPAVNNSQRGKTC